MSISDATDTRQASISQPADDEHKLAAFRDIIATCRREMAKLQPGLLPQATTAEQRGTDWTARYGCPAWCVMDHAGVDDEPGWHQGPRATAVGPKPFEDSGPGAPDAPLLSARVTQTNENPEVFGIETRLWVEVDTEVLELDAEQVDVLIDRLEAFLPQLHRLRQDLADAGRGDIPENAEAKAAWLATPCAPAAELLAKESV